MDNKPFFNKPKYMSIKLFIFSLSVAMILWMWGMLSTRDLINNAINQTSPLPDPSTVITNPAGNAAQPSTTLRKVQAPTPVPAVTTNSRRLPLTNTGSSRP
jgi:hypothetical protein